MWTYQVKNSFIHNVIDVTLSDSLPAHHRAASAPACLQTATDAPAHQRTSEFARGCISQRTSAFAEEESSQASLVDAVAACASDSLGDNFSKEAASVEEDAESEEQEEEATVTMEPMGRTSSATESSRTKKKKRKNKTYKMKRKENQARQAEATYAQAVHAWNDQVNDQEWLPVFMSKDEEVFNLWMELGCDFPELRAFLML